MAARRSGLSPVGYDDSRPEQSIPKHWCGKISLQIRRSLQQSSAARALVTAIRSLPNITSIRNRNRSPPLHFCVGSREPVPRLSSTFRMLSSGFGTLTAWFPFEGIVVAGSESLAPFCYGYRLLRLQECRQRAQR